MKKIVVLFAASLIAVAASAQPPRQAQTQSPEQIAEQRSGAMRGELNLDDKQYKKVYKVYLAQAKKAQSAMQSSSTGAFPGGGTGGMRGGAPGGMPDGGMGMDGPGGGMPVGGMGMPGGGQGGRMGGQRPNGPPSGMNRPGRVYEESEKDVAARAKKMKKILTDEQFPRWQRMENEHRASELRRQFDRNAVPPRQ